MIETEHRGAARALVRAAVDQFGGLDLLVNNAGTTMETPPEDRRARMTPLQADVTLEDIAESIYALATSHPFVTGETIVVDGGFAATT